MHAIAHEGVMDAVRESALRTDSGRKFLAAPGNRTCLRGEPVRCSINFATSAPPSVSIAVYNFVEWLFALGRSSWRRGFRNATNSSSSFISFFCYVNLLEASHEYRFLFVVYDFAPD